jgi:hypothetical protein
VLALVLQICVFYFGNEPKFVFLLTGSVAMLF